MLERERERERERVRVVGSASLVSAATVCELAYVSSDCASDHRAGTKCLLPASARSQKNELSVVLVTFGAYRRVWL